jgi:hypothetical protein
MVVPPTSSQANIFYFEVRFFQIRNSYFFNALVHRGMGPVIIPFINNVKRKFTQKKRKRDIDKMT